MNIWAIWILLPNISTVFPIRRSLPDQTRHQWLPHKMSPGTSVMIEIWNVESVWISMILRAIHEFYWILLHSMELHVWLLVSYIYIYLYLSPSAACEYVYIRIAPLTADYPKKKNKLPQQPANHSTPSQKKKHQLALGFYLLCRFLWGCYILSSVFRPRINHTQC